MKGRLENDLKITAKTKRLLLGMPAYVTDFYYSLLSSSEPSTLHEYVCKIKYFLDFIQCDITQATQTDVGRFFEKIRTIEYPNGEVKRTSFSYQRTYWYILNNLYVYLLENNIVQKNPFAGVSGIKPKKQKDEVVRPELYENELNKILSSVQNGIGSEWQKKMQKDWKERDLAILATLMITGMRRTALTEINMEDIDFKEKMITVIDKRNTKQEYILTPELEAIIKKWIKKSYNKSIL